VIKAPKRNTSELDHFVAVGIHDKLDFAIGAGVKEEACLFARRNRVAYQSEIKRSHEIIIVLESVSTGSEVIRETPDVPVREAASGADTLFSKGNQRGISVYSSESSAGNIVELARVYSGRVNRAYLSKRLAGADQGDYGCNNAEGGLAFHKHFM